MSVMRVRFKKLGGHFHCRVFTAPFPNETFAKNGDLVFDEREFEDMKHIMSGAQFLEDEPKPCPLCGKTEDHSHTSGPFGMS